MDIDVALSDHMFYLHTEKHSHFLRLTPTLTYGWLDQMVSPLWGQVSHLRRATTRTPSTFKMLGIEFRPTRGLPLGKRIGLALMYAGSSYRMYKEIIKCHKRDAHTTIEQQCLFLIPCVFRLYLNPQARLH